MLRACAVLQFQIEIVPGAGGPAADRGESEIRLGFDVRTGCGAELARRATSSGPRGGTGEGPALCECCI